MCHCSIAEGREQHASMSVVAMKAYVPCDTIANDIGRSVKIREEPIATRVLVLCVCMHTMKAVGLSLSHV